MSIDKSNNKRLLTLHNLTKHYGADLIFKDVNLSIHKGEKWGLIGPNGCGKTTLLRLIAGVEEPGMGQVNRAGIMGWVPQSESSDGPVLEYVLEDFRNMEKKLRQAEILLGEVGGKELEKALGHYQRVRDAYDAMEGDLLPARGRSILTALGLEHRMDALVEELSGGEKRVVTLARALLLKPELLILDEPGNHLDFKGLAWLENFLQEYPGAVLVVSHNRYLLDRVCGHMAVIRNHGLETFKGNYSSFRMEDLRSLVKRQADFAAQEKKLDRLETMVKKYREYASRTASPKWGKRLKAARTRLGREKEQGISRPELDTRRIGVNFEVQASKSRLALQLSAYSRGFGERVLYREAELEIFCGEKVALLGANGCGKTTLLKDIVGYGGWDNPCIRVGPSLKVGYLSQNQDTFNQDTFNQDNTIAYEFQRLGPLSLDDVFSLLSPFLFSWEDMNKKIAHLSGGEKNRLQLARLMYEKKDFLILDEPTNHLDIPSREAVEEALENFEGTLLVVSHDRYFLDKITARVVVVEDQSLIPGGSCFTHWWSRRKEETRAGSSGTRVPGKSAGDVEAQLTRLEEEKLNLEKKITAAFSRGEHQEGRRLSVKLEKVGKQLTRLYGEWEALSG